jgi:hypothetical protein
MRIFALAALLAVGCAHAPSPGGGGPDIRTLREAVAAELLAVGPPSEFSLMMLLNGEPTKLGVLTSTGTSVNETTTAVPFTVTAGSVLLFKCDAGSANVGGGTTCENLITDANHRYQLANAFDPYFLVLKSTHICLDAPAATTINCAVFRMQGP